MRKGLFAIGLLAFFLVMTGLASAGQFGPTEPTANPGKFSLGLGYFWEDTKWDVADGTLRTQSNQVYLQGSSAPVKNFEIFGRLGGADWKTKDLDDTDLKDDAKLFGTLGAKVMFYEYKNLGLGAFAQGTYHFQDYKDSDDAIDFKIRDYYDVQAGISGQFKMNDCIIYGGGFWYYSRAKISADTTDPAVTIEGRDNATMEEKTPIGGFLGVKIPLTKQLGLNFEGQYRDEFSGGAILTYSF